VPAGLVYTVALGGALTAAVVCASWVWAAADVEATQERRALGVLAGWLLLVPAALLTAVTTADPHSDGGPPIAAARDVTFHLLLAGTAIYVVLLMAAQAGFKVVRPQRGFPLVQPLSLVTSGLDLAGSTALLVLGRFGAKLFHFRVDIPHEAVCMFEEMLDRAVVSHPHQLAAAQLPAGRVGPSRLLQKEYRLHFRFIDLGLMLRSGKLVLQGVTGEIRPGEVTAIMGPSGAGKTSFMMTLAGKAQGRRLGRVLVNGIERRDLKPFQRMTGFVPQEDVVHRNLTVGENMQYAAQLRTPWFREPQKLCREVLMKMRLYKYRYSIVGDEVVRGISGGQRKRLNIGLELVRYPPINLWLMQTISLLIFSSGADSICTPQSFGARWSIAANRVCR
jgi:ABC-type multidrug transport system fused ATPase/permease subunit